MTKITQNPDGTVSFELTITKETIATEYQKVLLEVSKTIAIKGFRPGKAPLKMVETQSDKSQLYSHVLDHLLSPAYSDVIREHKLVPLVQPRVTPKNMEQGKDWVMAVELAVSPEIKLGDYTKFIKKIKEKDKDKKLNLIFDTLLDNTKFAVAPLLIEEETKSALSRLANQLQSLKLTVEDYAKSIKKTPDELIAQYKKSAESNLKLEFILYAITKDKNFTGNESRRQTLDFLSAL